MTYTLSVRARDTHASAQSLREAGTVPAVVYGTTMPSTPVVVDARELAQCMRSAGESTIIQLAGLEQPVEALIKHVDFHPLKGSVDHVDFYAIERGRDMTTDVPLEFTGESPAIKQGAVVNKVLHEVSVTCRPSVLPSHITVDLTVLAQPDTRILVTDLVVPEGVTVNNEPEEVVAIAAEVAEETAESPAFDVSDVAVEQRGKEETTG